MCSGVVLQRVLTPAELPPPKLARVDLPSDDEVEVVTEWLAPPVLEGRSNLLETPPTLSPPTSPPLHVPVIQRPSDQVSDPVLPGFRVDLRLTSACVSGGGGGSGADAPFRYARISHARSLTPDHRLT